MTDTVVITCEGCGRTTADPDKWDPEADTGRILCDTCWSKRPIAEHSIPTHDEIRTAMHTLDMLIVAAEDDRLQTLTPDDDFDFIRRLAAAYTELDDFVGRKP